MRWVLGAGVLAVAAAQCLPTDETCLPSWEPTYDMYRSTVLYICNNSGYLKPENAVKFGVVVFDWSNAKALWANSHPMDSQRRITVQADMVLKLDPGVPGQCPRVWAYRNTIKALNWYDSVREKLDDPKYASWFIKFKDYKGRASNSSYHVPACDWYGTAGSPPKCSGFYHDQEQTPEHQGGGGAYPVDGQCVGQCDCGPTNPCGEYIFDHRGGEVEGRTFREWYINEYMITNETLLHKPTPIGLGWLDDSMTLSGPTEEDRHFQADTGFSNAEMQELTEAYQTSIIELKKKVLPMGGFWWQLMSPSPPRVYNVKNDTSGVAQCKQTLREYCQPKPPSWNKMQMYKVDPKSDVIALGEQYTAEFLLTRGPYALLGWSWCGCTNGDEERARPKEWTQDYGAPSGSCQETGKDSGVFTRQYSKATVQWDCQLASGKVTQSADTVVTVV